MISRFQTGRMRPNRDKLQLQVRCGMRRRTLALGLMTALWPMLPWLPAADLETEARAILERRCLICHGPPARVAGLDLSNRESALRGASKGPALKPGLPGKSL